ncbi:hypothetical protein L3X38_027220 [Prunus dulcis]|uniref:Uncharacterized protein n=1 Tax=Prunus dulcis TaxID=3755 RepID=A0AAD4VMJ1_PRUDU|nr:hypothetical protein L3X38_027220 [Prunus dulcis]
MNRADPASKRLAPRQPRLLPCRRKTHFRGNSTQVSHQPISPRASALFPAEDLPPLIPKLDSILAWPF